MTDEDLNKIANLISNSEQKLVGLISNSEQKLVGLISNSEQRVVKLISDTEHRIIIEVGRFISDNILTVLDEKADKSDIDRLERKLDYLSGKVMDHEQSLKDIKSLPTVAHEFKLKRS